ncbi:uncharacterized protein LOC135491147 [Lineus longissimus]|uniref:uncharacterized protein LOC135491147 n=1 Tax=Lineus longissimus TaxID=88925 RepID=UPI002B4D1B7F
MHHFLVHETTMSPFIETIFWVSALFFCYNLSGVSGSCSNTVTNYVFGNESTYDRDYSSITSGKKPLGFSTALWRYNTDTNPCVKVAVSSGHRIEVMMDTEPPNTRICVKEGTNSVCQSGKIYDCRPTRGNTMTFEFYCDAECAEADVNFWYRFTLSKPPGELDPELWCDSRDSSAFPDSLIKIPIQPRKTTPKPVSAAPSSQCSWHSIICFIVLVNSWLYFANLSS